MTQLLISPESNLRVGPTFDARVGATVVSRVPLPVKGTWSTFAPDWVELGSTSGLFVHLSRCSIPVVRPDRYHSQWDDDAGRRRSDCGPASIVNLESMLELNTGRAPSNIAIDLIASPDATGYTKAEDLVSAAQRIGLSLRTRSMSADQFWKKVAERGQSWSPIVLHSYWPLANRQDPYAGLHWSVIVSTISSFVQVLDPNFAGDRRNEGNGKLYSISSFSQAVGPEVTLVETLT